MRGCRGGVVGAALLALSLLACGDEPAGSSADGSTPPTTWVPAGEIAGVRTGDDARSLVVEATGLPRPGATGACAVEVEPWVQVDGDNIHIQLIVEYGSDDSEGFAECEREPRDVVFDVGQEVAGRPVFTQMPEGRWQPGADGVYQLCALPGCDPDTGQPPADVTCDDSTLADAARHNDAPHARLGPSGCELPWAVIDVDAGAGACPATGEPADNPCAGQNVRRLYWKADGARWELVAESFGSGCGDVAADLPDFPADLCEDLPALP